MKLVKFKPTDEKMPLIVEAGSKYITNLQGEYTVFGMLPDGDWAPIAGKCPVKIAILSDMRHLLFRIDTYTKVYDGIANKKLSRTLSNYYAEYIKDRNTLQQSNH